MNHRPSAQLNFDLMILPIIPKWNHVVRLPDTIDNHGFDRTGWLGLPDRDVEDGFSITIVKFERLPVGRQTRGQTELVDFQVNPQE